MIHLISFHCVAECRILLHHLSEESALGAHTRSRSAPHSWHHIWCAALSLPHQLHEGIAAATAALHPCHLRFHQLHHLGAAAAMAGIAAHVAGASAAHHVRIARHTARATPGIAATCAVGRAFALLKLIEHLGHPSLAG